MRLQSMLVALLFLVACDTDSAGPPPVTAVQVTPSAVALAVGDSVQIIAAARTETGEPKADAIIAWSVTDSEVVTLRSTTGPSVWAVVTRTGQTRVEAHSEGKVGAAVVTGFQPVPENPLPVLTTLYPAYADQGGGPLAMEVRGSGFQPQSVVLWNGVARTTAYVSALRLRFTLTPADLAFSGTAQVSVSTPAPGGGTSAARTFIIYGPVATIEVTPSGDVLWVGESVQLRAVAKDRHGRELSHKAVRWQPHDPSTVSVDANGKLTALKPGATQVNGWVDDRFDFSMVAVMRAPEYDLIFERDINSQPELWRVSPGPNPSAQRIMPGVTATRPAVSRSGKLAYVGAAGTDSEIFAADTNGTNIRRLTHSVGLDSDPAWSPDGSRIAFVSARSGYHDIWVMNADGSDARNLTGAQYRIGMPRAGNPAWSPDGASIVYDVTDAGINPSRSQIYVVSASGGEPRRFTLPDAPNHYEPEWSPDGERMVSRRFDLLFQDYMGYMDRQGRDLFMLGWPGAGYSPTFSPDGNWLAFWWTGPAQAEATISVFGNSYRKQLFTGRNPVWVRR